MTRPVLLWPGRWPRHSVDVDLGVRRDRFLVINSEDDHAGRLLNGLSYDTVVLEPHAFLTDTRVAALVKSRGFTTHVVGLDAVKAKVAEMFASSCLMNALTLQQPWAWLVVQNIKRLENRDRRTRLRGPLLIHAGLTVDQDAFAVIEQRAPDIFATRLPTVFQLGGIVGKVELRDCMPFNPADEFAAHAFEADQRRWAFGPWLYLLGNATPLPFTRCRGMPGFFTMEWPT